MARGQQVLVEVLAFSRPASNGPKSLEIQLFGADTSTMARLLVAYVLLCAQKIRRRIRAPLGLPLLRPSPVGPGSERRSLHGAGPVLRVQDAP